MAQFGLYRLEKHANYWGPTVMQKPNLAVMLQNPKIGTQKASKTLVRLLAACTGKTLESMLDKFPTKEFDNDDEYTWDVISSARRNIPLVEARDETGAVIALPAPNEPMKFVGANTMPFYLVFGEHWWAKGETLEGELNEIYQMRIIDEPRDEGTNTVYKVELMGGNTNGIPADRLQAGERFSGGAAFVERSLSRKVGGIRFSTPMSMRNEFSVIRIHSKVGGDMLDDKTIIEMPVAKESRNGYELKRITTWMHYADWELETQFSEQKNWALAWARGNRDANGEYRNIGDSGNVIKVGAGIFQQMEAGNTFYYNKFSIKMLTDALYELSASKLEMGDRTFVMCTGEKGAIQFNEAITQLATGWTWATFDNNSGKFIRQVDSKLHRNALGAGFQFVEYYAPNGVVIKLCVMPFYDDRVRNKRVDPDGSPMMSRRYDIFDLGTSDQPNIFKCGIKGKSEVRSYQWGLRNPWTGQWGNQHMSYDEDSAVVHKMAWLGACVLDPTRTMSLIPIGLAG